MSIKPFDPKFMKVGILTAAFQELTPREVRDPDPDRAIEEWLDFAKEIGASTIVVGTVGENPISGALLGSVVLKLVQRSPTPLLIVPTTEG